MDKNINIPKPQRNPNNNYGAGSLQSKTENIEDHLKYIKDEKIEKLLKVTKNE